MLITSVTNPRIKFVMKLQRERRFRQKNRQFVAEGERWLRDVLNRGITPSALFVTETAAIEPWRPQLTAVGCQPISVTSSVMKEISTLDTPPGILLVLEMPDQPFPADNRLLLILDRIQNPGNLGNLLRTAAAAGADAVLLAPGCVDPYNPKVVRGSMGALLRIPTISADWPTINNHVANHQCWIADASAAAIHSDIDWQERCALIIGNEASGAGTEAQALGKGIRIPMAADTESLNAANAAAVILFEAARQRGYGVKRSI